VCHKKSATQRLLPYIIYTSPVNVIRFLSNLSEFGGNNLIWVSRSQSQFFVSCTMLKCLTVAFTAASSLHSCMRHWSSRNVWHWRTLQLMYCVYVAWRRSDDAPTETEALKLFLNKSALQADFVPRLQCGRIKVTYTQNAVQISAFRGRLLQLNFFSKKKLCVYSFFQSQMGKFYFYEKEFQILANLWENTIRQVIITPFSPFACSPLLLNNVIC
jgi:hypothetical protein